MLREMFSTKLEDAGVRWLEPAWKSIISNKALLPLLWEMFPNHPNLLPAYFAEDDHPQMQRKLRSGYHSYTDAGFHDPQSASNQSRGDGRCQCCL